ncbi:hypothetical protein Tco_1096134, partial [Tanacetum coccineum]
FKLVEGPPKRRRPLRRGLRGGGTSNKEGPPMRRGLRGGASKEERAPNLTEVRLCISAIASSVGKPLVMDTMTANMCHHGICKSEYAKKCGKRPENEEEIAVIVTPKETNVYGIDSASKGFVEVNNRKNNNKGTTRNMIDSDDTIFVLYPNTDMLTLIDSKGIHHSKPNALQAFVEANYEVLESLIRDRRRHVRNEDVRTKLDYYRSPRARRHRGRVVKFKEAPNRDGSRVERKSDSKRPLERMVEEGGIHGGNLPTLLVAHLGRSRNGHLQPPSNGQIPSYVNPYTQPHASMTYNQPPSHPFHTQSSNPSFRGASLYHPYGGCTQQAPISNNGPNNTRLVHPSNVPHNSYPFYTQPTNPLPNAPMYQTYGPADLFAYSTGYNGKKASKIANYKDFKAKFWSYFSQHKKFTKTHLVVHNIKYRDGESTRAFVTRYIDDTLQILGLHEEQRIFGFVHGLKTRSLVEFLFTDLTTTYKGLIEKTYTWIEVKEVSTIRAHNDHKEGFDKFSKGFSWDNKNGRKKNHDRILATKKAAKAFEQPPRMVRNRRSCDMSKYCHFHKDHRHETNQCQEAKAFNTQLGKWKKGDKDIVPAEEVVLMVKREDHTTNRKSVEEVVNEIWEITFSLASGSKNSSDPVIIRV